MNTVEISGFASQNAESPDPATCHAASTMRITAFPQDEAVDVMPLKDIVATSPLHDTESAGLAEEPQMAERSTVSDEEPHCKSEHPFLSTTVTVRSVESVPLLTMEGLEIDAELTCGKTSTLTLAVYEFDHSPSAPQTAVMSNVACG